MALESKAAFVKCIEASKVLSDEKLADAVRKSDANTAKELAVYLIKKDLLTSWQAKFLLTDRHNLRLDNYILTNRLTQDELGDRFEARHESLDRPVILQLLPKSVSSDPELREFFVAHVGRITELDHPHLVDVHDVDEHVNRFYVVNEYLNGDSIVDTVLDSRSLVRCANQALQGVAFAQSFGLVHGQIGEESIFALNNGNFKVTGLGLSALRRKLKGGDKPLPEEDFVALAKVLSSRFEFLPDDEQVEFSWFKSLLDNLESDPLGSNQVAIDKTTEIIATWTSTDILELATVEPQLVANVPTTPAPVSLAPVAPRASTSSTKLARNSRIANAKIPWFRNPTILSGFSIVALVFLIVGLWVGGAFERPGNSKGQTVEKDASETAATSKTSNDNTVGTSSKKFDPKKADVHGALRKAKGITESNSKKSDSQEDMPPPAVPAEKVKRDISEVPKTSIETPVETPGFEKVAARLPAKPETRLEVREEIPSDPPQKVAQPTEPEPIQTETVETKPEQTKPEPVKPEAKPVNVLASFASSIDFPLTADKEEFVVGELSAATESFEMSVVSSPGCFRTGKGAIELQNVDAETWNMLLKARVQSDESEVVGQFKLLPDNLTFRWGEAVGAKSKANFVRNCTLNISANSYAKTIDLRQPVEIPPIALTEAKYKQRVTASVNFAPQASMIKVEVGKPTNWPETFLQDGPFDEVQLFDEGLTELPMYFSQDAPFQFLTVVFKPVVNRTNLQFNLNVYARGKDTDAVELRSHEAAVNLFNELQGAKEVAFEQKQQAELIKANAPKGKKRDAGRFAKEMAANFDVINENVEIATDLRDLLSESLHDAEFSVTVFYELDGRRIILAKTSAQAE